MSQKEGDGDVAFLLYLVPFIASTVYAVYLWSAAGLSLILPQTVFLGVTQSPYVFLVGFLAVVAGAVLDATGGDGLEKERLSALSTRVQYIAVVSLVLSAVFAWYAGGFDVGTMFFNFLEGRYSVVFSGLLMLFSFLILPVVRFQRSNLDYVVGILCLLVSPAVIYEVGKRIFAVGMAGGVLLIAIGLVLLYRRSSVEAASA